MERFPVNQAIETSREHQRAQAHAYCDRLNNVKKAA
jgi:hypothetical protein